MVHRDYIGKMGTVCKTNIYYGVIKREIKQLTTVIPFYPKKTNPLFLNTRVMASQAMIGELSKFSR